MEITIYGQMLVPTGNYTIDGWVDVVQFLWVQHDGFIGIFKQVGQYRSQGMVTVGAISIKIVMR